MSGCKPDTTKPERLPVETFLLRLWQEDADGPWRILLLDAVTGERHGFTTLEPLFHFLDAHFGQKES